jgi:hypothetical protein
MNFIPSSRLVLFAPENVEKIGFREKKGTAREGKMWSSLPSILTLEKRRCWWAGEDQEPFFLPAVTLVAFIARTMI